MHMKIVRFVPLLAVLAVALLAAGCGGGGGGSSESVPSGDIATVGSDPITKAQYDQLIALAKSEAKAQHQPVPKVGTTAYKTMSDRVVAYLVAVTEYQQKAKQLGVTNAAVDSGVQKQLDKIKKVTFHGNKALYESQLKASGLTEAQLKYELHGQVLAQDVFNKVTKKVVVTPAAIQKFYDNNKAQYTTAESREVRHILVSSKSKAQSIRSQLVQGAAFATLAKKYSTDTSSAKTGGKLCAVHGQGTPPTGCISTVPPFDKAAFSLKTNEISQPVHSTYGWHIIQAVGPIKPAKIEPLKSVQASIKTSLLDSKKSAAVQTWLKNLKKEYAKKVSYQTGYAPAATATTGTTTTTG
jgi:foldase protein PrsA